VRLAFSKFLVTGWVRTKEVLSREKCVPKSLVLACSSATSFFNVAISLAASGVAGLAYRNRIKVRKIPDAKMPSEEEKSTWESFLSFAYSSWVWMRSRMIENVRVKTRERKRVKPVK
jgi:hypothetical protein